MSFQKPTPNAIHWIWLKHWDATTTSVSTVCIVTLSQPFLTMSSRWRKIRASASSCVHGANLDVSQGRLHSTFSWYVLRIILSVIKVLFVTIWARKANNSSLFSLRRRNSYQFPGTLGAGSTRRRTPLPRFSIVSVFKLSGKYLSQIISTLVACCRCDFLY